MPRKKAGLLSSTKTILVVLWALCEKNAKVSWAIIHFFLVVFELFPLFRWFGCKSEKYTVRLTDELKITSSNTRLSAASIFSNLLCIVKELAGMVDSLITINHDITRYLPYVNTVFNG